MLLSFPHDLSSRFQLVHPGNAFDTSYVRLFRVLDGVRQKLQHSITDQLRSLQVSKEWCLAGRLCSPRVLFIFESCLLKASGDGSVRGKNQVGPQRRALKQRKFDLQWCAKQMSVADVCCIIL